MTLDLGALTAEEKRQLLTHVLQKKLRESITAPLSFQQRRLWFIEQLEPGNILGNLTNAARITGHIKLEMVRKALDELVRRQESLRTTFHMEAGEPFQVIGPPQPASFDVLDLTGVRKADEDSALREAIRREAHIPFDLTRGPLFRVKLVRLAENDHVPVVSMHHIISDGWSTGIALREFGILYDAFTRGAPSPLPELPIQYRDYATWQAERLQGPLGDRLAAYWKRALADAPHGLELPTDRPRTITLASQGARILTPIADRQVNLLRALGATEGATLYMVLLATFSALLHRITGQDDILLGTPVADRERSETQNLIGFLVNTVVIRMRLPGDPTFRTYLRHVRNAVLESFEHRELSFEKLIEVARPERNFGLDPLIQVMFALHNIPIPPLVFPGLKITPLSYDTGAYPLDLAVEGIFRNSQLDLRFAYKQELFDEETVQRLVRQYLQVLQAVTRNPDQRVSELPLLTSDERAQILVDWNRTSETITDEVCLHHLIEQQADTTPDSLALLSETKQFTYREVERKANQLAHYLMKTKGCHPDDLIGICLTNSPEAVISLLAVLKAGCAYMPLDPRHPPARLARMIRNGGVRTIMTSSDLARTLPDTVQSPIYIDDQQEQISLEPTDRPKVTISPKHLAYVIFTSGSTGEPKGVMIEHESVVNLVRSFLKSYAPGPRDRVLQQTSLSFDASVGEIFPILAAGGTLVFHPDTFGGNVETLVETAKKHQVTILGAVPSVLALLNERVSDLPSVRLVLSGGEPLFYDQIDKLVQTVKVTNAYGPTETTVCSLFHTVDATQDYGVLGGRIPIGRPVINTRVYVLDTFSHPVPVNVAGQLFIAGAGLARGYLNELGRTAESFLPDPFVSDHNERMYKTGDLVRYRRDGTLEFLGRCDSQVKIRGLRIEPDEIAVLLRQHGAVLDAAVVPTGGPSEERQLIAYFVPTPGVEVHASDLRKHLLKRLPAYMVPSHYKRLQEIARTPGGKVDASRLQISTTDRPEMTQEFVAPRSEAERSLAAIWAESLRVDRVGVHDDFFSLGGHSLLAVRLIARVNEHFGATLPVRSIFEAPTVSSMAEKVTAAATGGLQEVAKLGMRTSSLHVFKKGTGTATVFCIHHIGGQTHSYRQFVDELPPEYRVYGIQSQALADPNVEHTTLEEMVAAYAQSITAERNRAVHLVGYSSGGLLALACAKKLELEGAPLQSVVLIDTQQSAAGLEKIQNDSLQTLILTVRDAFPQEFSILGNSIDTILTQVHGVYETMRPLSNEERIDFLCGWLTQFQMPDLEQIQQMLRRRLQLYNRHSALLEDYRPAIIRSPLYVCLADTPLPGERIERGLDWGRLTTGETRIESASGNHFTIMKPPTVTELAGRVSAWFKTVGETRVPVPTNQ
jgi:amino acid adenylation domain-containing protein